MAVLAESAEDRAELVRVLPHLERAAEPCGAKFVISTLAPLLALYGLSHKSEGEAQAFWDIYVKVLGETPREALRKGVDDYTARADAEWFPKPGPLKALCEPHAIPIRMAVGRARKAIQTEPRVRIGENRSAEVKALLDEMGWKP